MKKTFNSALVIGMLALTLAGCKGKDGDPGPAGPTGQTGQTGQPGPEAKTFNFTLTFTPSISSGTYNGITGYDANDAIIVYALSNQFNGTNYWVQLPFMVSSNSINIWPEISETTGNLIINTTWADGSSGSPWTENADIQFKAVLIKSSARMANPSVNYKNYEEVAKAFNLK